MSRESASLGGRRPGSSTRAAAYSSSRSATAALSSKNGPGGSRPSEGDQFRNCHPERALLIVILSAPYVAVAPQGRLRARKDLMPLHAHEILSAVSRPQDDSYNTDRKSTRLN